MQIKNNFPSDVEKERIKTLRKYQQLYDNRQEAVLDLHEIIKKQYKDYNNSVYVAHAIPAKITDFYSDFVSGDNDKIQIQATGDNNEENETLNKIVYDNKLTEKISDFAVDQSRSGFEVLLGMIKNKEFVIQAVNQDQYFPQKDGSVIFATYFRDPNQQQRARADRDLYLYIQYYRLENEDVKIERSVWLTDNEGVAKERVSLDKINKGDIKEEETLEGLGELPIVQIDNGKRTRWGFGKSDYHDIMPQLSEINERVTHISTQLLKNLNAKLELQENKEIVDEKGNLEPFDFIMLSDKDAVKTRYVTNDNPLLDQTFKHIDKQINFISWISGVPIWDLEDKSKPERVEALRIKLFSAVRKANTKRAKIKRGIKDIIRIGFKMLDKELESSIEVNFSSVLPTDKEKQTKIEQMKINAGLTSRKSAIKRLENYTDEEAERELERIKEENLESGALNPENAPEI